MTWLQAALAAALTAHASAALFISEYVEGSSNNKAIELYNDGSSTINLAGYKLEVHFNDNLTPGSTALLTGSVAPRATFVVVHSSAAAELLAKGQQTRGGGWFNGDDVIVLRDGTNAVLDSIGQRGHLPPGGRYGTPPVVTKDAVLRRLVPVTPDTNLDDTYNPAVEWEAVSKENWADVGQFDNTIPFVGFSEYLEGSGDNKALEILNGASTTLDLTGYKLEFYFDGASTAGTTITLTGNLAAHTTYVVVASGADALLKARADLVSGATFFDGNDAVVLRNAGNVIVDSIGRINENPGSYWGTTGLKTQNLGLRRVSPAAADTVATNAYDTAGVWEAASAEDYSNLGQFIGVDASLYISEYLEGLTDDKALELFNSGSCALDLTGFRVFVYRNGATTVGKTVALTGSIAGGGAHVIIQPPTTAALTPLANQVTTAELFNGNDAVVLVDTYGVVLDSIGRVGENPGTAWTNGPLTTHEKGLRRVRTAVVPDRNPNDAYTLEAAQWEGADMSDFSDLGSGNSPYYVSLPSNECTNDGLHRGMGELYLTYATQADCCNALPREKRAVCLKTATKVSPDYEQGKCVEGNPRRVTYPSCVVSGTGSATHVSSRFLRPSLAVATPSSCCAAMYGELGADAVRKCESERGTWHVISGGHCLRDGPLDDDPMMHATTRFESDNSVAGWNTCLTAHFKRSTKFTCADHVCSGSFTAKSSSIHCGASQADCTNELCCEKVCA
eukprot:Rhum_TRINITY_DN14365_c0_g1::Rhum_TRINITY_DN14365_c0_g1_i3::g.83072::m.83072